MSGLVIIHLRIAPKFYVYVLCNYTCTGWGGHLCRRFCKQFSESCPGPWPLLKLPGCPSKQGELLEKILQNLRNKWPLHPVDTILIKLCYTDLISRFNDTENTSQQNGAKIPPNRAAAPARPSPPGMSCIKIGLPGKLILC